MPDQIEIRQLTSANEIRELLELEERIWDLSPDVLMADAVHCITLADAGNGYFAAYSGGLMVGMAEAVFGRRNATWVVELVALGVAPGCTGRGIATALLNHIRRWALQSGISVITFHFDPLVRENAHLYLTKFGGIITEYRRELFGPMRGINASDVTDRVLVTWQLDADNQTEATSAAESEPVLVIGDEFEPVVRRGNSTLQRIEIPRSIYELRRASPELALQWRFALRSVMEPMVAQGARFRNFSGVGYVFEVEQPS